MPTKDKLGFVNMILKLPRYLFLGFDWMNKIILNKLFQTAPFIYSLLAVVCMLFAIIIIIILFFARFNLIPREWKNFIPKTIAQQIYSTLHLISSFFILSSIVYLTFYKDINITGNQVTKMNMLSNTINNNTAGVIILQVIIISIIVILVFLMSVISNALTKAYYGLKSQEVNETPSLLWWAKLVDLLMYGCCILSSMLLILFFIAKLLIPNIPIYIKSSIQTFFVISIVYVVSQLFLNMLRDIVSNNLLSFVVPNTHREKMLYFVLNVLLAIIIWMGLTSLLSYNFMGFFGILRGTNKVLSTANKIMPIFYGIIPPSLNNYIEPFIAKLGIDPNQLTTLVTNNETDLTQTLKKTSLFNKKTKIPKEVMIANELAPSQTVIPQTTQTVIPQTTQTAIPQTTQTTIPQTTQTALPQTTQTALPQTTQTAIPQTTQTALPEIPAQIPQTTIPQTTQIPPLPQSIQTAQPLPVQKTTIKPKSR